MRLVRFQRNGDIHGGVVEGDEVISLGADDLQHWFGRMDEMRRAMPDAPRYDLQDVQLVQPISRPGKILAIGLNYAAHVAESVSFVKHEPGIQKWFNKQATAVTGPDAPIYLPVVSEQMDYEGELVAIIGKRARHVPESRAMEIIAGFTCGCDVSVRDWQRASQTMIMGKGFDSHAPIGPWIVTPDEFGPLGDQSIRCSVNGEVRQSAKLSDMIHTLPQQIAHLTAAFTLEPGDLIFTGTPAGVGAGHIPPKWLTTGDVVEVEIEGIGTLRNTVEPESGKIVIE